MFASGRSGGIGAIADSLRENRAGLLTLGGATQDNESRAGVHG
jgi:hypothetical protein